MRLTLGHNLNFPLTKLPFHLTHLVVGERFTHSLDGLPPSLTHMILYANLRVDRLPPNITHLFLVYNFNKPITMLPRKLTHLVLGHKFNHPLTSLPSSLTHLAFHDKDDFYVRYSCGLKELHITCKKLKLLIIPFWKKYWLLGVSNINYHVELLKKPYKVPLQDVFKYSR